jgi:hypothetical protein
MLIWHCRSEFWLNSLQARCSSFICGQRYISYLELRWITAVSYILGKLVLWMELVQETCPYPLNPPLLLPHAYPSVFLTSNVFFLTPCSFLGAPLSPCESQSYEERWTEKREQTLLYRKRQKHPPRSVCGSVLVSKSSTAIQHGAVQFVARLK